MESVNYSVEYMPGAVRAALFLGLHILLDGWLPLLLVSLVDGVDLPPGLALKIQIRVSDPDWIWQVDPDPGSGSRRAKNRKS
jgi:hypothetical protein